MKWKMNYRTPIDIYTLVVPTQLSSSQGSLSGSVEIIRLSIPAYLPLKSLHSYSSVTCACAPTSPANARKLYQSDLFAWSYEPVEQA